MTRRLVYISIFTALIVLGGLISVPIPFTQVELSFQTVFVIMAGLVLGGRDGALAVLVYLAMGLLGLPVFTQGGGVAYVFKPSFGYLIGFPIGALVAGSIVTKSQKSHSKRSRVFVAALVGMIPVYVIGASYQLLILYYYIGSSLGAAVAGLPAVIVLAVKDGVLLGLVASVYPSLERALGSRFQRSKRAPRSKDVDVGAVNSK
ncbi:MAG: biotin transporter BioY [Clostridiales bacterium]|nr:biotin transporter BioY [Clostridiales bacterium]